MKVHTILLITVVTMAVYFVQVNSRRSRKGWGKIMADGFMGPWEDLVKGMEGGRSTYKYWHHRKDLSGRWHKRKYGNSDSGSSSRSRESRSRSDSGSHERRSHHRSYKSSSSSSSERRTSDSNTEKSMAVEAFTFFVDTYGCENVTAFQHFVASYNEKAERDGEKPIRLDDKDELLHEMSKLAKDDLANGNGEQHCSQDCAVQIKESGTPH